MSLPTGTVTLLFTDIEGSTALLRDLGPEAYARALEDHRRLLREAFARHAGHEVDTEGDAFLVAFARASDAIEAARDAQSELAGYRTAEGRPLRVRMGLHTSDATATASGYVGLGVHRGARICAAGHGGQVLMSHTTADLIRDEEDGAVHLLDLGEHRLKDLTESQRLYQLVLDPQRTFPPLRTLENRPTNLPIQSTSLVGRAREVGEVVELLAHPNVRLVTLTGPGGTGKTRLGLQAAAESLEAFPNGVYLVSLAAIADPQLILPTIAGTLGLSETAGQSLAAYLATRRMLLVLDNFEHLVEGATQFVELLGCAPGVKLLVTSMEPLHIAAEHVYPVLTLALPDPRHLPELVALSRYDAVALFIERAQQVQPAFALTIRNAPAVAEICVRLDGLPLALELAAARVGLMTPDQMLKRLADRFKLLAGGRRDLPERQQTLRATLAWSHALLDPDEQRLFARLGVFRGSFSLEGTEGICDAELSVLGSLVDKSLVRRVDDRFAILETIRDYALERLAASGEEPDIRDRHATYSLALAEQAYPERFSREQEWSTELEGEHDNLQAALEWLERTDPRRHLALSGALGWFWHVHSHFDEGLAALERAIAANPEPDDLRARALAADGELAAWRGDAARARSSIDQAISIWRDAGREQEIALAQYDLGWAYFWAGDDQASRGLMEASLEQQRRLGNPALINRAEISLLQVLVSLGEVETVERLAREALALAERLGDLRSIHFCYHFLADSTLIQGDPVAAVPRYRRSLEAAVALGDRGEAIFEVQGLAMASGGLGHAERALRLAGAADSELASLGIDISGVAFWQTLLARYLGPAEEQLGPVAAEAARADGRRRGFDWAIQEGLSPA